jgi:hypothetical protein
MQSRQGTGARRIIAWRNGAPVRDVGCAIDSYQNNLAGLDQRSQAQAFQSSMGNMSLLLTIAIVIVYIIQGILYESFIHPLAILSGLPSAAMGALLTLWLLMPSQLLTLYIIPVIYVYLDSLAARAGRWKFIHQGARRSRRRRQGPVPHRRSSGFRPAASFLPAGNRSA